MVQVGSSSDPARACRIVVSVETEVLIGHYQAQLHPGHNLAGCNLHHLFSCMTSATGWAGTFTADISLQRNSSYVCIVAAYTLLPQLV